MPVVVRPFPATVQCEFCRFCQVRDLRLPRTLGRQGLVPGLAVLYEVRSNASL